jgi:hypothetical protein
VLCSKLHVHPLGTTTSSRHCVPSAVEICHSFESRVALGMTGWQIQRTETLEANRLHLNSFQFIHLCCHWTQLSVCLTN